MVVVGLVRCCCCCGVVTESGSSFMIYMILVIYTPVYILYYVPVDIFYNNGNDRRILRTVRNAVTFWWNVG